MRGDSKSWGYSFGRITIQGRTFTRDLIVLGESGEVKFLNTSWWREEGHELRISDLFEAILESPEVIVIGTGANQRMKVLPEVYDELKKRGIRLIELPTGEALEEFKRYLDKGIKVIGAFHLTC